MDVLGFNLQKGEIRFSLLTGTKQVPRLVEKGRHLVIDEATPQLMDWFESTFDSIITRTSPDRIAYRLSLEPTKSQIQYLTFPYAILNLLAHRKKIEIYEYVTLNFTASKFGQPKGTNVYEYCTKVFGEHPPHWDKNQQNSILAAWLTLKG
jgi:hypothetical protein